jgi:peptidoglycan hydrolase-like protein with peptidoglycan-binding domain
LKIVRLLILTCISVFFGAASVLALPDCPRSPISTNSEMSPALYKDWTNCVGVLRQTGWFNKGSATATFKDGKPIGKATVNFNGVKGYVTFKYGLINGPCEFSGKGEMFSGECKDNFRVVTGFHTKSDGSKYSGEFNEKNKYHGRGIRTHADGAIEEGIWKNGFLQYPQKTPYSSKPPEPEKPPILKSAFLKLTKNQRKLVQRNLADFGFYNSSIDGLYGRGTAGGLTVYNKKYLKDADLDKKSNVNKLFSAILSIRSNKRVCSEDVLACTETQLCSRATNGSIGQREWSASKAYVAEAKRRSLKCEVVGKSSKIDLASKQELTDLKQQLAAALAENEELKATGSDTVDVVEDTTQTVDPAKNVLVDIGSLTRDEQKELQTALKEAGVYDGAIDGIMGKGSMRAIQSWQEARGYDASGKLTVSQSDELLLGEEVVTSAEEFAAVEATEPEGSQSITSVMIQIARPTFDVFNCAFNLEFTNSETGGSFDVVMFADDGSGKFTATTKDIQNALTDSGLTAEDNDWSQLKVKAKKYDDPNVVCKPTNQNSYSITEDGTEGTFNIDSKGHLTMMDLPIVAVN